MLKFIKTKFMNLKINYKITLSMVFASTLAALLVGATCNLFFTNMFEKQNSSATKNTLDNTIIALQQNINTINTNVTYLLSSPLFREIYYAVNNNTSSEGQNFVHFYNGLQEEFYNIIRSTDLIEGVALLGKNGEFFSTNDVGLKHDDFHNAIWNEEKDDGIQWLPVRKNPLFSAATTEVVPIVYPISYSPLLFSSSEKNLSLVVLVNSTRLSVFLEQMNRAAFSRIYLASAGGLPLNVSSEDNLYSGISSVDFCGQITGTAGRKSFMQTINDEKYRVTADEVGVSGLWAVSLMPYSQLAYGLKRIQTITILAVIISFFISLFVSSLLARTITRPVKQILKQVKAVQNGNYHLTPVTRYNDEIHILDKSIVALSETIRHQMNIIKEEETLKHKAEMDALTEQINPHFLYNTLDAIHWEILSGQTNVAANMIESLGSFLRLSLNHGEELLVISSALLHTQKYMDIMNCRLEKQIAFRYTIAPELQQVHFPKLVLQPLVENSIRHGFGEMQAEYNVQNPCITITAKPIEGGFTISVEDNGKGIDIEKAESYMQNLKMQNQKSGGLGLYNIYRRLQYHFGNSLSITFFSIPYYKNIVLITIPFVEEGEATGN